MNFFCICELNVYSYSCIEAELVFESRLQLLYDVTVTRREKVRENTRKACSAPSTAVSTFRQRFATVTYQPVLQLLFVFFNQQT